VDSQSFFSKDVTTPPLTATDFATSVSQAHSQTPSTSSTRQTPTQVRKVQPSPGVIRYDTQSPVKTNFESTSSFPQSPYSPITVSYKFFAMIIYKESKYQTRFHNRLQHTNAQPNFRPLGQNQRCCVNLVHN
jgi:hypothetical protein